MKRLRLLGLVALVVALLVPAEMAQAGQPALRTWQVAANLSLGEDGVGLSCPDATTCWSLESGRLLSSTDGGQSWTDRTALVPADVAALDDIDCPSSSRCYTAATSSAGAGILLMISGGVLTELSTPAAFSSISCPALLRCVGATDTMSYVTADGGQTWSQASLGRTLLGPTSVDCVPQTQVCALVGNYGLVPTILRSTTGGRSWTMQTAPYNDGGIYDVACPTVSTCYATGADYSDYSIVISTVDSGAHWTFDQVPFHNYPLRSVSCPAELTCTAVGHSPGNTSFVFRTVDGQQWTAGTIDPVVTAQAAKIACPTLTSCVAVASAAAFRSQDGGASWQTVTVPAGLGAPQMMSCSTGARCVAAGADDAGKPFVITSADAGTTWTSAAWPAGAGRPTAIDCPQPSAVCFALASVRATSSTPNQTQFLISHNRGATWSVTAVRNVAPGKLTCPSPTSCLATAWAGQNLKMFRTTDSGQQWKPLTAPGTGSLVGLACGSVSSCVAFVGTYGGDWNAWVSSDLGTTFASHAVPSEDWYGFDCAGTLCVAVGSDGGLGAIAQSHDGGISWQSVTPPPTAELIGSVSCGSETSCAASTFDFNYDTGGARIIGTSDGGTKWTVFAVPARREAPLTVTCPGNRCLASDYSPAGNPIIVRGWA